MTTDPRTPERPGGPGPGAIHPAPRTGPLQGGPARTTQDHFQDQDHPWEERLQAIVAEVNRKREAERAQRAQLTRRRGFGLRSRHAQKLARTRRPESNDSTFRSEQQVDADLLSHMTHRSEPNKR